MARCSVCNRTMFGGYRAGEQRFCSLPCYTASPTRWFCASCLDETTSESPGNSLSLKSVGTRLSFPRDRCSRCHSIVQTRTACALLIPIIPLGRYRVIYTDASRYVGRRLRDPKARRTRPVSSPPDPTQPK